jgi:hypothetical protein
VRKICKIKQPFKVGAYPSDLDKIGCNTNGKTRPVVPVTFPRPEKVKRISFFEILQILENRNIEIFSLNCIFLYTHVLMLNRSYLLKLGHEKIEPRKHFEPRDAILLAKVPSPGDGCIYIVTCMYTWTYILYYIYNAYRYAHAITRVGDNNITSAGANSSSMCRSLQLCYVYVVHEHIYTHI